jgi:hypothetical protein
MPIICPYCRSPQVRTLNHARKAGGFIGAMAGLAGGAAGTIGGVEAGLGIAALSVGVAALPFGFLASAIFAGIVGGISGGTAGAKLGELIDEEILDNFHCRDCQRHFGMGGDAHVDDEPPDAW